MAYDAGAIEARLTIATAEADADLAAIEARVRALEDRAHVVKVTAGTAQASADLTKLQAQIAALEDQAHALVFTAETAQASAGVAGLAAQVDALDKPHVITISAVFENADIAKARRAFMMLDNAISYDAMQRLRSSPQGSVLGSLNALFSPHPVTGGPSPQQSAAKGLLGQMFSSQGGGTTVVPGAGGGTGSVLRDVTAGAVIPGKAPVTAAAGGSPAGAQDTAGTAGAAADLKAAAAAETAAAGGTAGAASDLKDAAADLKAAAAAGAVRGLQGNLARSGGTTAAAVAPAGTGGGGGGGGGGAAAAAAQLAALGAQAKASGQESQSAAARLLGLAAAATTAAQAAQYASAAQKTFTGTETDVGAAARDAAAQLTAMTAASASGADASRYAYAAQAAQALAVKALASSASQASPALTAVGAAAGGSGGGIAALGTAAAGAGANVGFLKQHISLFGGALGAIPWVGAVTGLHLVIDGLVETAAEVIPAAIAFGAFAAAAVPAVMSIYAQEKALYTVSQAFNQQMPGLSGNFQKVAAAVQPEVYVLMGEALDTMNHNTGTFMTLATGAGRVLDELGARAEMALGSKGASGFAQKAVDDLQVLGNIIGNVSGIFGNMLKVMPGYAEILFHAIQDVTGAIEAMTGNTVVQGILSVGLAFHGAIVWGGLAASGFVLAGNAALGLVQKFGILKGAEIGLFDTAAMGAAFRAIGVGLASMGADLLGLDAAWAVSEGAAAAWAGVMDALAAINPLGWIAIGIGAIAGLVVWLGSMKTASQQAFDAFQKQIADATTFTTAFTSITQGVQQANSQLAQTPKYITVTRQGMHDFSQTITELNPAWSALTSNVKAYGAENATLASRMAELNKVTGSQANTLAYLNQIGVKAGSVATESAAAFANQKVQVQALTDATTQLAGFTGGEAAAAQNALTNSFMTGTLPAIQKVTGAEDALLGVIIGGQTALDTFEQGIGTLAQNLNTATGSTATVAATLANLKGNAKLAGAALGGTTTASYALNQAFYAQVTNGQKLIDSLMQQGISTGNLQTVTATTAGQMLQFAGTNTEARSVIVDLINNALGPGTVSMQTLNTWVGKNSTSLGGLNKIIATSTINAGNLTGVLSGLTNQMYAQDIMAATLGPAISAYVTDLATLGANSPVTIAALKNINTVQQQTNKTFGVTVQLPQQIQAAIDKLHGTVIPLTVSTAAGKTDITAFQGAIDAISQGKVPGLTADNSAGRLATANLQAAIDAITQGKVPSLTADPSAGTAEIAAFQQDINLIQQGKVPGLTADNSAGLSAIATLQKAIDAIQGKTVNVTVMGNDTGTLTASGTVMTPNGPINAATGYLEFHAAGGLISGGTQGRDSVLGMLMPGEVVVPAHMVAGGAVDHLRGMLPGFAFGGMVSGAADRATTWAQDQQASWGTKNELGWGAMLAQALAAARKAEAVKEAAAAAAAVQGIAAGAIEAAFVSMAAARGWTGAQLTALLQVEQREAGFNMTAQNPTSSAYGLAQFINGPSEYATWGGNSTTASGQITAMLNYIAATYGTPQGAWNHELSYGWYDRGGSLQPGYTLAYNGTGRAEHVMSGASVTDLASRLDQLHADMREMVNATRAVPAGVGAHVGGALNGAAHDASFRSRYPR